MELEIPTNKPSTTISRQIYLYIFSILLAPLGIIYALKYFKQPDSTSKRIAIIITILTILSLFLMFFLANIFFSSINSIANPDLLNTSNELGF